MHQPNKEYWECKVIPALSHEGKSYPRAKPAYHFNKIFIRGKCNSKGQNTSETVPASSKWLFMKLVTWQRQYCFWPAEPAPLETCKTFIDLPELVGIQCHPYLAGCWAQPLWPSCPRRSGSGRRGDTARRCRPPLPGCETDLWAGRGSARGTPCDWWCPTRRAPPPSGPWPGSTCEQGWCWRGEGKINKSFKRSQGCESQWALICVFGCKFVCPFFEWTN